ncbi:MAG: alanine:cation symporter family protein [Akkermansiaceae bacterium]|nr:alanine:cation symporter family protein [Akkermansiaceae bacterium]
MLTRAITMTETIDTLLTTTNKYLWNYLLLFLLLGTHLYLTFRLRVPQRYLFKAMRYYFPKKGEADGQISQFSALMVSMAANIGTGNIVGVAAAIAIGGPGAVFWCLVTGLLGIAGRYAESLLAIRYRVQDKNGNISGGPMYAIERGMHCKWLAVCFAVFTAIAAFGIGNIVQAHTISSTLTASGLNVPTWLIGAVLSALVAGVLLFGLNGISRICTALVPAMALTYIVGCGLLLSVNAAYIGPALLRILDCAFSAQAAAGGFIGSTIMLAMRTGTCRSLFATEAGLGSSPIVSAAVKTANPVQQALVASTGPFWTILVCTLTGITLTTVTLAANGTIDATKDATLTANVFGTLGLTGTCMLAISLSAFAISTLFGWSYFGEKSLEYLGGQRLVTPYRALWSVAVFIGCIIPKSTIAWNFSDIANGLMAIPNLICLVALSGIVAKETRYYLQDNNLDTIDNTPIPTIDEKN